MFHAQCHSVRRRNERRAGCGRFPVPGSYLYWLHLAFRGYADYMETDAFKEGAEELEKIALKQRTAYMCSEAVWWRYHRSMVSDYLKVQGWKVMHIMGVGKADEHPYTAPAKIVNGALSYENN